MADPCLLTVDELATFLRVNRKTVYQLIETGELPGVRRLGRVIRIYRPAIEDWLAGRSEKTKSR